MTAVPTPVPAIPGAPVVPKGVPAWLIRLVSLLLVAAGPALAYWNPGGHLSTPAVQAVIVVVFLVVGAAIFTIHLVLAAVHEHGFTMAAAQQVVSGEEAEIKELWPEILSSYQAAKPALDQIPHFADTVNAVTADVASVKATVAAIPAAQRSEVEAIVKSVVIPQVLAAPTGPPAGSTLGNATVPVVTNTTVPDPAVTGQVS